MKLADFENLMKNRSLVELVVLPRGDSVSKGRYNPDEFTHQLKYDLSYTLEGKPQRKDTIIDSPTFEDEAPLGGMRALEILFYNKHDQLMYKRQKISVDGQVAMWYGRMYKAPKTPQLETV